VDERGHELELLVSDDEAVALIAAALADAAVVEFRKQRGDESPAKASSPHEGSKRVQS
jgi:hypothetical protein